ncbi:MULTISPECIES: helix-turn-helix domain-containing protein [unclassified Pseudomonas]|uniref:helix-turn-helix domain-containing protein n=1 Tax=unclassified Pseudomonas TaxID=196821 RepID=UPI003F96FC65
MAIGLRLGSGAKSRLCRIYSADDFTLQLDNPPHYTWAGALNSRKPDHNYAFGLVLRDLRLQSGYSQERLGFDAGYDRTYISLLERGLCSPTLDTVVSLCSVLNVTLIEAFSSVESKLEELDASRPDPT